MFCSENHHIIGYGNKRYERMYQDPEASHALGLNNEEETGSAVRVVRVGPSIPVSSHGCSAVPVIHICSLSGQFPQPQALSVLTTTHRSSELILLLWQRTGDLGHAVTALFFLWPPKVMSTSSYPPTQSDLDIPR